MIARIFKTKGKNSPALLYFAHTLPNRDVGENLFLIANTGFNGDKEFLYDHPNCIGGLVQSEKNRRYLQTLGKVAIIGGDIQQRTFLRCIHSISPTWGFSNYSLEYDFFWAGTNPEIKRTYNFLEIILKTKLSGWVFAANQEYILEKLPFKFNKVELFKNYYVFKYNNIFIDCQKLYEQSYFEHILNHSVMLISTSLYEGIFPNSFLEAWSRNIPVIYDKNIKSYLLTIKGIEYFGYDGLENLIPKIIKVKNKLTYFKDKVSEIKSLNLGANPFELNFFLEEVCKEWYIANGYSWNGRWLGFLASYPNITTF